MMARVPKQAGSRSRKPPRSGAAPRLRGFAPIIGPDVELLILGSFPSEASLAAGQYYAHPRNQFWVILGRLLGEPLPELAYEVRAARVLAHRVGIWDVLDACEREGSLDTAIRRPAANDFARLNALAPRLRTVVFNGAAAGRFAPSFEVAGFAVHILPSTSPAHAARSLSDKFVLWRCAFAAHRRGRVSHPLVA
jgi:hypoxanthine-DNA glycosylase